MNLKEHPLEELKAEIQRREAEKLAAELLVRNKKNATIFEHRAVLLSLMEHSRTSCSDSDPANGFMNSDGHYRCAKCALMQVTEYGGDGQLFLGSSPVDLSLELSLGIRTEPF